METPVSTIEDLIERVDTYAKTTIELTKLKSVDVLSESATFLVAKIIVLIMLTLFVFTLSVAVALYIGELLDKTYYGFLVVAGFYLITGLGSYFFLHKWLKKPVGDLIIAQLLK
jgi:cytochrome c biogenesis protein CcdA